MAGGILVFALLPRDPENGPKQQGAGPQPPNSPTPPAGQTTPPPRPTTASAATDLALKEETFAVVRQLMADFPDSSDPIGMMGTLYNHYGNTAEAVNWWLKCLQQDPKRADVYHGLGMVAMAKGEYEKAEELWRKAQGINPNLPGVWGRYAEALMEMGKLDVALAALHNEIRISPRAPGNYVLLGKVHLQRKEYEEAIAAYTKAAEIQPRQSGVYYGLATASTRLGRTGQAAKYMERFTRLRAEENKAVTKRRRAAVTGTHRAKILAQTLTNAGRLYADGRRARKAEECWQRAASLVPGHTPCRQQLVLLYMNTQREEQAVAVCEQLRKIDPHDPTTCVNMSMLLARLKRFDAAEGTVREAIRLAPKRPSPYRALVQVLLMGNRKLPEAKALARKLVALSPTAGDYGLLGEACQRAGDRAGAVAARRRAAELARSGAADQRTHRRPPQR